MPRNSLNGTGRHFPEPGVSEHQTESAIDDDALEALAELAEAEAAEAAARAKVARARARAARLRLPEARIPNAEEGAAPGDEDDQVELDPVADGDDKHAESEPEAEGDVVDEPGITHPVASPKSVGFWRRRPRWSRLALVAGILGTCGFVAITAVMLWQHHNVEAQHQRDAAFVNAARHDVEALLSIDYSKASEDVQHVIDSSTGKFHDEFAKDAKNFIEAAQKAKAVSKVTVSAAALQSVSGNSATVLVSVASKVTNANGANQDARAWRMRVTVDRDGDKLKMSGVEFVP